MGHAGFIRDLDVSKDGSLIASGGADGFVRIWTAAPLSYYRRSHCQPPSRTLE
ncbi:MAG: WD40 repeat domain-containing protein [Acidimicrobiia bacterium]